MVQIRKEELLMEAEKRAEAMSYIQGLVELRQKEGNPKDSLGNEEIMKMMKYQEREERREYPDHFLCKILLVLFAPLAIEYSAQRILLIQYL